VEDYESMVPFQVLLAMGHQVNVFCPRKKSGGTISTAIRYYEGDQTYTEKLGHKFELNAFFEYVNVADYAALYLQGGRDLNIYA
jgi:protease I